MPRAQVAGQHAGAVASDDGGVLLLNMPAPARELQLRNVVVDFFWPKPERSRGKQNPRQSMKIKQAEDNLKAQFRSYDRRFTHALDKALGGIDGTFQHSIEREMKQEMLDKTLYHTLMKRVNPVNN